MKSRIFTIRSESVIDNLCQFLKSQPDKPLLEVAVYEKKKDRTASQNSLYWSWVTVIENELGMTKEDTHNDLKKRLLVPIYERDEPGYAAMINAVRKVHTTGMKVEAEKMAKQIVRMTSTTGATVKQFAEYLNEIERVMIDNGIVLPHPEDRYFSAMGIKST